MEEMIRRLDTVKKCENLAKNAMDRDRPDVAAMARVRSLEIRADEHEAANDAEREALQAVYAHEESLSKGKGKRTRASGTWLLVRRHGIIEAVERAVSQKKSTTDFDTLEELGLSDFAFEAVIVRHPEAFSEKAVKISKERLGD